MTASTFERAAEVERCRNCAHNESQHVWRCNTCNRELTMGMCGCGSTHLPAKLCHGGATLFCPAARAP